jgi:hypothetical protein
MIPNFGNIIQIAAGKDRSLCLDDQGKSGNLDIMIQKEDLMIIKSSVPD